MTEKIAFVFPGQGSQYVGMGCQLREESEAARRVFEQADELFGSSLTELCAVGPEEVLRDTANAQPAIFVNSLAVLAALRTELPECPAPSFVAGHSLGEFTALVAGGSLSLADGLALVKKRGELMSKANNERPGTMAAVLGMADDKLEQICRDVGDGESVIVANYNSAGQVVISGEIWAVEAASRAAKDAGAKRVVPLSVGAAFHSPLMQFAVAPFSSAVAEALINDTRMHVVSNITATPLQMAAEIRTELSKQLISPVRWSDTVAFFLSEGVTLQVELGAGQVLTGLAKRSGISCVSIETLSDLDKLRERLASNG